jgi:hypothetical protein
VSSRRQTASLNNLGTASGKLSVWDINKILRAGSRSVLAAVGGCAVETGKT